MFFPQNHLPAIMNYEHKFAIYLLIKKKLPIASKNQTQHFEASFLEKKPVVTRHSNYQDERDFNTKKHNEIHLDFERT